ncbi:cytospin-B isoform X4 [Brienomyrus brachyistius]|uniref:cytospin-B isoform X4 n=1 Tax=Brienomyrus brachyistius TaxID=42636 RepID=UPI0020B36BE5|nr:cytospin-B isoform X4 [Brienomyrus brachyistius]
MCFSHMAMQLWGAVRGLGPEDCGPRATRAMMKGGATKGGLPKPAVQEKGRLPSASSVMAMKSSRSSGTLAADLRHSRLKRASSDDALAKPGLGAAAVACRMKKTVTTGAICELADNRPHSLTGVPSAKKSGIPAPREIPPTISRDRSLRTAGSKKMIPSSSSSNLSGLGKSTRTSVKAKVDSEAGDRAGEKAVLECQVKELLAEAKAKEFEISKLRTELQRCKGRGTPDGNTPEGSEPESQSLELQVMALREKNGKFQRELAMLREENQALKEKLLSLGESASVNSPASPTKYTVNGVLQDGSPPKISPSSSSDITKGSSSPDSSEFEKIPSRSDSSCSGPVKGCGDGRRELSVECLTEKIQRMEESHHSTAEELQATLQELSDQQQVMQELTAENERLAEEKVLLQTSLQQQRERVELLTQKNESLLVRLQEQAETDETRAKASRMAELEQRHAELVKNSHFEREKLVDIQQQLTGSLRALEKEHQEAQGLVRSLKEERDTLQTRLEKSQEANSEMVEVECQRLQELCAKQEQEHSTSVRCLEESSHEKEVQIKELKETIFELEDQVEQHRTVRLHTNQTILDLEGQVKKLEEQKLDLEKQLKALSRQMKDETEEWRRFQADLQTAVVVANDIKVEAQQEVRGLRRRLQEEQERNITLEAELEQLQGGRLKGDEVDSSDTDGSPRWCGISVGQMGSPSSEPGATVKSLIKSFDSGVQNGPSHTVAIHSSTRSPLSGIPVRTAPAAAVSPIQRHSSIKPLSKALEKRINLGDFAHPDKLPGLGDDLKPSSLMRKSPSLESVIKSPGSLGGRTASLSYPKANSKLSVERKDPLAALARQYGGSKRNALLKWCQRKTEGYPNIDVTNFSSSWSDGLAFCALLHTYLPAHIPYQELISQDKSRNLTLAFQAAESVGIKPSLDISEMLHTDRPDWQSVMQYVSQIYKYFET